MGGILKIRRNGLYLWTPMRGTSRFFQMTRWDNQISVVTHRAYI